MLAAGAALAAATVCGVAAAGPLTALSSRAAVLGPLAAVAAAAAVASVVGTARLCRPARPFDAEAFHVCDRQTLWSVVPGRITAVSLSRLADCDSVQHLINGKPVSTLIRLWFHNAPQPYSLALHDARHYRRLFNALGGHHIDHGGDGDDEPPAPALLPPDARPAPPTSCLRAGILAAAAAAAVVVAAGGGVADRHARAAAVGDRR